MSLEQKQPSPASSLLGGFSPPNILEPGVRLLEDMYVYAVIGIIKRKALIRKLASVYHAECLAYCQELLELQKKWNEPFIDVKSPDDLRKKVKPSKRIKKCR